MEAWCVSLFQAVCIWFKRTLTVSQKGKKITWTCQNGRKFMTNYPPPPQLIIFNIFLIFVRKLEFCPQMVLRFVNFFFFSVKQQTWVDLGWFWHCKAMFWPKVDSAIWLEKPNSQHCANQWATYQVLPLPKPQILNIQFFYPNSMTALGLHFN